MIMQQKVGKYTVRVEHDDDEWRDPFGDQDFFGALCHWHKRGFMGEDISHWDREDIQARVNEIESNGGIVLSVYLYEHSGQTISAAPFSCPWDSGQVGFIYATGATIRKEYGVQRISAKTRAKAESLLRAEIETLDHYLRGNIWGYVVDSDTEEHIDSCWGFVGDPEYCLSEGVDVAEWFVERDRKERQDRIKTMIRNRVPLEIRANQGV